MHDRSGAKSISVRHQWFLLFGSALPRLSINTIQTPRVVGKYKLNLHLTKKELHFGKIVFKLSANVAFYFVCFPEEKHSENVEKGTPYSEKNATFKDQQHRITILVAVGEEANNCV